MCPCPSLQPPCSSSGHPHPTHRDIFRRLQFMSLFHVAIPDGSPHDPALRSPQVCEHTPAIRAVGRTRRFPLGLPHLSARPLGAVYLPGTATGERGGGAAEARLVGQTCSSGPGATERCKHTWDPSDGGLVSWEVHSGARRQWTDKGADEKPRARPGRAPSQGNRSIRPGVTCIFPRFTYDLTRKTQISLQRNHAGGLRK